MLSDGQDDLQVSGTQYHGTVLSRGQSYLSSIGYVDSDCASDMNDKMSTTRYVVNYSCMWTYLLEIINTIYNTYVYN